MTDAKETFNKNTLLRLMVSEWGSNLARGDVDAAVKITRSSIRPTVVNMSLESHIARVFLAALGKDANAMIARMGFDNKDATLGSLVHRLRERGATITFVGALAGQIRATARAMFPLQAAAADADAMHTAFTGFSTATILEFLVQGAIDSLAATRGDRGVEFRANTLTERARALSIAHADTDRFLRALGKTVYQGILKMNLRDKVATLGELLQELEKKESIPTLSGPLSERLRTIARAQRAADKDGNKNAAASGAGAGAGAGGGDASASNTALKTYLEKKVECTVCSKPFKPRAMLLTCNNTHGEFHALCFACRDALAITQYEKGCPICRGRYSETRITLEMALHMSPERMPPKTPAALTTPAPFAPTAASAGGAGAAARPVDDFIVHSGCKFGKKTSEVHGNSWRPVQEIARRFREIPYELLAGHCCLRCGECTSEHMQFTAWMCKHITASIAGVSTLGCFLETLHAGGHELFARADDFMKVAIANGDAAAPAAPPAHAGGAGAGADTNDVWRGDTITKLVRDNKTGLDRLMQLGKQFEGLLGVLFVELFIISCSECNEDSLLCHTAFCEHIETSIRAGGAMVRDVFRALRADGHTVYVNQKDFMAMVHFAQRIRNNGNVVRDFDCYLPPIRASSLSKKGKAAVLAAPLTGSMKTLAAHFLQSTLNAYLLSGTGAHGIFRDSDGPPRQLAIRFSEYRNGKSLLSPINLALLKHDLRYEASVAAGAGAGAGSAPVPAVEDVMDVDGDGAGGAAGAGAGAVERVLALVFCAETAYLALSAHGVKAFCEGPVHYAPVDLLSEHLNDATNRHSAFKVGQLFGDFARKDIATCAPMMGSTVREALHSTDSSASSPVRVPSVIANAIRGFKINKDARAAAIGNKDAPVRLPRLPFPTFLISAAWDNLTEEGRAVCRTKRSIVFDPAHVIPDVLALSVTEIGQLFGKTVRNSLHAAAKAIKEPECTVERALVHQRERGTPVRAGKNTAAMLCTHAAQVAATDMRAGAENAAGKRKAPERPNADAVVVVSDDDDDALICPPPPKKKIEVPRPAGAPVPSAMDVDGAGAGAGAGGAAGLPAAARASKGKQSMASAVNEQKRNVLSEARAELERAKRMQAMAADQLTAAKVMGDHARAALDAAIAKVTEALHSLNQ